MSKSYYGGMERIHLSRTNSTNNYVKSHMPARGILIVTADTQTSGKGRLGRGFSSRPGGLYMSIGFYPARPAEETLHYTALTGLAVSRAIHNCWQIESDIKWPNDVLVQGKKVCGILLEAVHSPGGFFMAAGMGINVSNPIPEELQNAASLSNLTGRQLNHEDLADMLSAEFLSIIGDAHDRKIELLEEYAQKCITIGRPVQAASEGKTVSGTAAGIDENAALIVETPDGEKLHIISGEATLRA